MPAEGDAASRRRRCSAYSSSHPERGESRWPTAISQATAWIGTCRPRPKSGWLVRGGSESIARAQTEIGQPLVMSGEVGVRYMVEEQRQAKGGGEPVAKFHALVEERARAQTLVAGDEPAELAVMHRAAEAEAGEQPAPGPDRPSKTGVGVACPSGSIEGQAKVRSRRADRVEE